LGFGWLGGSLGDTIYNHVAPPNWLDSDCSMHDQLADPNLISGGAISARSFHSGGVNALTMDGSVHFIKNGIELTLWRGLATRAGSEAVNLDSN
jgi:prepilin-type processing-associated H-X9-DG protein